MGELLGLACMGVFEFLHDVVDVFVLEGCVVGNV